MAFFNSQRVENARLISDKLYYFAVAATLFIGFAVNAVEVVFFADAIRAWNPVVFFLIYLISAVAGIIINIVSTKPAISFLGYLMVVLPLGMLLALVVPASSFTAVTSAFLVTALLTAIFSILAIAFPRFFNSVASVVSIALVVAFLFQIVTIFVPIGGVYWGANKIIDWLIVIFFSCYIGLDMWLATKKSKTLDNAIDSACGLYINVINVFVRLIAIFSRSGRRN